MAGEEVSTLDDPNEARYCPPPGVDLPPLPEGNGRRMGVPRDQTEARIFMASYAAHQVAISSIQFQNVGQLVRQEDGTVIVGPLNQQAIQLPGPPWSIGPHQSLQTALFEYWDKQMESARKRGQLRLRGYLSHLDKKRLLRSYGPLSQHPGTTYIKHADEAMFQYFWQEGRLSAVLDWEWSVLAMYVRSILMGQGTYHHQRGCFHGTKSIPATHGGRYPGKSGS